MDDTATVQCPYCFELVELYSRASSPATRGGDRKICEACATGHGSDTTRPKCSPTCRVGGGDELRQNDEMLRRWFTRTGHVREAEVRRAAVGGDRDLAWLLAPSRERALVLDKAYLAIVRAQSFTRGRDATARPASNVHRRIENGSTDLDRTWRVFRDGQLRLD